MRRLAASELAAGRTVKEAVKGTRRRLHQIGAVYLDSTPQYESWLRLLDEASRSGDRDQIREACRTIMACHQSVPAADAARAPARRGSGGALMVA